MSSCSLTSSFPPFLQRDSETQLHIEQARKSPRKMMPPSSAWIHCGTCSRTRLRQPAWLVQVLQSGCRTHLPHCWGSKHWSCPKRWRERRVGERAKWVKRLKPSKQQHIYTHPLNPTPSCTFTIIGKDVFSLAECQIVPKRKMYVYLCIYKISKYSSCVEFAIIFPPSFMSYPGWEMPHEIQGSSCKIWALEFSPFFQKTESLPF
jgi:hypothetical protein